MFTAGTPLRRLRHKVMPVAILTFLNILHFANVKTFDPWSQVTLILSSDLPLLAHSGDFHFYRTLVASPGLWLEGIWPEHGFSLYASLFVFLVSLLFAKIHRLVSGRAPQLWTWFPLLAVFMLMNGRGAFGWAGWLLCVHACLSFSEGVQPGVSAKTMLQLFLGLSIATISSGVFVTCIVFISYFAFAECVSGQRNRRWRMTKTRAIGAAIVFITLPVAAYLAFDHAFDAVRKVLTFYGGGLEGLIGIASHGVASQIEGARFCMSLAVD